jgi:hypothetical protein
VDALIRRRRPARSPRPTEPTKADIVYSAALRGRFGMGEIPAGRWRTSLDGPRTPGRWRAAILGLVATLATGAAMLTMPSAVRAADPTPPFGQCPAVGHDAGCAILIVIEPNGSLTILRDATQGPLDGSDDTLVGVQNNSSTTAPSVAIGSTTLAVFGFEAPNDGLCSFTFAGNGYCTATPRPATGYEGPDTTFSAISGNKRMGTVNFTDAGGGLAAAGTTYFSLEGALLASSIASGPATSLAFTGASATSSDFADPATVAATLKVGAAAVPNAPVTFTLGTGPGADTCTANTNTLGVATCSLTPTQAAGPYQLVASFAGSSMPFLGAVNTSAAFTVTHEQDGLVYGGAASVMVGQPFVLSGALTTDDPAAATRLAGKTVLLTLGSGSTAQSCSGVTDTSGLATCTVASVAQAPGSVPASANYAGDGFYVAAAAVGAVTVTAPPPSPTPTPTPVAPGPTPVSSTPGIATPGTGVAGKFPAVPAAVLLLIGVGLAAVGRRRGPPA